MNRLRVPHTLVLLCGMILLAQVATWVLPQGSYQRAQNEAGREVVVPDSYQRIDDGERLPWYSAFTAIPRGFSAAEEIIFFCFLIGGAFGVMRATGAIEAVLSSLLRSMGNSPFPLVALTMLTFAAGSSLIGMAEEYLPMLPILVALAISLGYDRVTGVGILCVGYAVGYGTAAFNPFTLLIAQDVAGVDAYSGMAYRWVLFTIFLAVGIHHVYSYARRVKADPTRSLVADIPAETQPVSRDIPFRTTHGVVLAILVASIIVIVYGLSRWHWYLIEMGAIFVGLSVVLAFVARMDADTTARKFVEGAAELTTTALLIGFARTIQVVLDDGQVVDTIIHGIAQPLKQLGPAGASVGMLVVQSLCNFFIPSGSGQAYVTMPLMAPLADIVGVGRQVAVLAYQFGDGFTNILVPTNAVLVGILAMAGVPFDRWVRFVLPFMVKMWVLGGLALAVAVWIGYA